MSTLYSVKDVANIMKVDVHYVYNLINKGKLPALKLKSYRIREEALNDFLKSCEGYDLSDLDNIQKLETRL